jgi:oligopeptide/dipeptide ABC transporter ATP-binding protein
MPRGCAFAPRCAHRRAACDAAPPAAAAVAEDHRAACILVGAHDHAEAVPA